MYCTKCGKEIQGEIKFCPECGTQTVGAPDSTATKSSQPTGRDNAFSMISLIAGPGACFIALLSILVSAVSMDSSSSTEVFNSLWVFSLAGAIVAMIFSGKIRTSEVKVIAARAKIGFFCAIGGIVLSGIAFFMFIGQIMYYLS